MRNRFVKLVSVLLCAGLLIGGVGGAVYGMNVGKVEPAKPSEKVFYEAATSEEIGKTVKDETVYVFAGSDGGVKQVIVSDWLKNQAGNEQIIDSSELSEIENVKGDETYTTDEQGNRIWDAQGKDIYYQGGIEKELPVTIAVSYQLDGKEISAKELAGKSGKVTIRFAYQNHAYEMREINGSQENIYVPFVVLTGMFLDTDVFTNVEISNGKLVNDGNRLVAVGIALPGLQNNLQINEEKVKLPDYVEVTADVKNFALENTLTVVTNEVFNHLEVEKLDTVEELTASLQELKSAMIQLIDGASQLYDGLCTLLDQSGQLTGGIEALSEGAEKLKSGAGAINTGAAGLADGAAELEAGLGQLTEKGADLDAGAAQVFEALLHMADGQLAAAGLQTPSLTAENYGEVLNGVIAALESNGAAQAAATISGLKGQLDSYAAFYAGLNQYIGGVVSAKEGAGSLYTGAAQLQAGAGELYTGASELYDGANALKEGVPALTDGVIQLRDGALQLSDGLKEFNEQGVQKLVDAAEGDLGNFMERMKATISVSQNYKSFSCPSDGMEGRVKFVYRTDAI